LTFSVQFDQAQAGKEEREKRKERNNRNLVFIQLTLSALCLVVPLSVRFIISDVLSTLFCTITTITDTSTSEHTRTSKSINLGII
jgi:hypothetical protein